MNRYDDIHELLTEVATASKELEAAYKIAAMSEDVQSVLRPKVKSSLEHLRSCLEYCAQDTYEAIVKGQVKRLYFPYGKDEATFKKSVKNHLPNLETLAPRVFHIYESVQPHKSQESWLIDLCDHTNFNKHDSLTKPERVNSPSGLTSIGDMGILKGVGTVTFTNSYIGGAPVGFNQPLVINNSIPISEMQKQLPSHMKVAREFDWVEFRFPGTPIDALALISKAYTEICSFVEKLKAELS